eukprot:scaffold21222_cov69-Cyclotella_meneghiniana.AAC.6
MSQTKVHTQHLQHYASSIATIIIGIALIIACSTLPESNAFAIIDDSTNTRRVITSRPKFFDSPRTRHVLNSTSQCFNEEAAGVVELRGGGEPSSVPMTRKIQTYVSKNFFLLGMIAAVSFAKLFPELGRNGSVIRPELFIGKYGVTTIFLISGISLKLQELTNAASNMKLNGLIQTITFGAWPFLVGLPMTKCIEIFFPGILPQPLIEGLLILSCLPTTINMCIILTSAAGGNGEIKRTNLLQHKSNLAGIFITPALLLHFFGKSIELPFLDLVKKLCSKVLLPVALGQALRETPAKELYSKHTGFFKRFQEIVLLGIVWNAFCNAFTGGLGLEVKHAAALSDIFGFTSDQAIAATFCGALTISVLSYIFRCPSY